MSLYDPDRLYELLPQYIRAQDVEQGHPLRALLQVIAQQVDVVKDNISQLYDNWFIETCEDWVVPYIGELIGYEPIETLDNPGVSRSPARDRVLVPRREVANTLRYRARKGTLAVLEELAMDVTGWVAVAVEFFNRVPVGGTLAEKYAEKVRQALGEERFEAFIESLPTGTSVGLFIWRKRCYSSTLSTPHYIETQQAEFYSFSPLGNDTPLYTRPERRGASSGLSNLSIPITLEMFGANPEAYYGDGKSFCIYAPEWPPLPVGKRGASDQPIVWKPIPSQYITPRDLGELRKDRRPHFPDVEDYQIAVDPALSRFIFPARPRQRPERELRVSYYSGFNADIGGGEYQRPLSAHPDAESIRTPCAELKAKLEEAVSKLEKGINHILIEITDSGQYLGWLPEIVLKPGQTLQIRAANRRRPVVWLTERSISLPDSFRVLPYPASCFILDGVMVAGRGLHIDEPEAQAYVRDQRPARVIIRHSTLVPGWQLLPETEPVKSEGASIELNNVFVTLLIQRSIIGSISVIQEDIRRVDPSAIVLEDSILDSTAAEEPAIYGEAVQPAYVALTVRRSTVLGEVEVRELLLAENSIFRDKLTVHNRQGGIIRYSYFPDDSNTPRHFRCHINSLDFKSVRYGTPDYCRLDNDAANILEGTEHSGEMGVYYHLFDPLRAAILKRRLKEYLPIDVEPRVFWVTEPGEITPASEEPSG